MQPESVKQVSDPSRISRREFSIGFFGWFLLNGLFWWFAMPEPGSLGIILVVRFIGMVLLNLLALLIVAVVRRNLALGMVGACVVSVIGCILLSLLAPIIRSY